MDDPTRGYISFEINILAGEWLELLKLRFGKEIAFSPEVNCLTSNEHLGPARCVANLENRRELPERKTHSILEGTGDCDKVERREMLHMLAETHPAGMRTDRQYWPLFWLFA